MGMVQNPNPGNSYFLTTNLAWKRRLRRFLISKLRGVASANIFSLVYGLRNFVMPTLIVSGTHPASPLDSKDRVGADHDGHDSINTPCKSVAVAWMKPF